MIMTCCLNCEVSSRHGYDARGWCPECCHEWNRPFVRAPASYFTESFQCSGCGNIQQGGVFMCQLCELSAERELRAIAEHVEFEAHAAERWKRGKPPTSYDFWNPQMLNFDTPEKFRQLRRECEQFPLTEDDL